MLCFVICDGSKCELKRRRFRRHKETGSLIVDAPETDATAVLQQGAHSAVEMKKAKDGASMEPKFPAEAATVRVAAEGPLAGGSSKIHVPGAMP